MKKQKHPLTFLGALMILNLLTFAPVSVAQAGFFSDTMFQIQSLYQQLLQLFGIGEEMKQPKVQDPDIPSNVTPTTATIGSTSPSIAIPVGTLPSPINPPINPPIKNPVSFGMADIANVTMREVDPIPGAADDEYTLYTIKLKSGVTVQLQSYGMASVEMNYDLAIEAGFTGTIQEFYQLIYPS